jgi:hypothetical protein
MMMMKKMKIYIKKYVEEGKILRKFIIKEYNNKKFIE